MTWLMSGSEYEALVRDGEIVKRHRTGVKVWRLPGARMVKIFRPKGWLSRDRIYPRSIKFVRNAARLKHLGLRTVDVMRVFYCPAIRRHGVLYHMLPGRTLAECLGSGDDSGYMQALADLVAELHQRRIYFRSLHLGNVVVMPDGGLGLIDIQELHFRLWPLGRSARVRNFRHLLRNPAHHPAFARYGMARFVDRYLEGVALPEADKLALRDELLTLEPAPVAATLTD